MHIHVVYSSDRGRSDPDFPGSSRIHFLKIRNWIVRLAGQVPRTTWIVVIATTDKMLNSEGALLLNVCKDALHLIVSILTHFEHK